MMKWFIESKWMMIVCGIFILTGCGFHLGPQHPLPEALHTLYLETDNPYGSLQTSLRKTLSSSDVTLVSSPQEAPVILQLSKPTQTNTSTTVGPSSQSRIYIVTYSISYTLKNNQGKILLGPRELRTTRNLVLDANQLLQSNNQLSNLYSEMERDIVMQLYGQLRSEQVLRLLTKTPS